MARATPLKKKHAAAIAEGKRKSWRKGGASRIAFEKRRRAAKRTPAAKMTARRTPKRAKLRA